MSGTPSTRPFTHSSSISTSVGQEGLDFHHYAHAIVHWNIPSNPVDLEQREGRVHRYKNHAVRKNVAADFRHAPELVKSSDPWSTLFDLATAKEDDIKPWWIYPGEAAIERLVPMLPLSREVGRLKELIEATSLYRMTMGQPRQSELIEVLAGRSPEEQEWFVRPSRLTSRLVEQVSSRSAVLCEEVVFDLLDDVRSRFVACCRRFLTASSSAPRAAPIDGRSGSARAARSRSATGPILLVDDLRGSRRRSIGGSSSSRRLKTFSLELIAPRSSSPDFSAGSCRAGRSRRTAPPCRRPERPTARGRGRQRRERGS